MGEEKEALELFLTNNIQEAKQISERLNQYNIERQETENKYLNKQYKKLRRKIKMCHVLYLEKKDGITEL